MKSSLTLGAALCAAALLATSPASAQIPDAKTLLAAVGLDGGQIDQVMGGEIVRGAIKAASERELVAAASFLVKQTPAQIVTDLKSGLGNKVDEAMIAFGNFSATPSTADLAKLSFGADAQKRAKPYLEAQPGGDVNLSSEEIAAFQQLAGQNPAPAAVEDAVRKHLVARVQAYQQKGLAGIAPYALSGGKQRSPAEELKTATEASKALQKYVPGAYQMLLAYPASKPAGTEEVFRWTHFDAHGTPTISLQHGLYVPDGDAYLVVQRMFYVSGGFNAEQALLALLPVQGGTVVVYANRTSTDQVAGFGGGAKRSIGSKLLESQLDAIFEKARAEAAR
jgi:hypothetical protein